MPTFTNQATLLYNTGAVNSNIVTGELLRTLSATKTVLDSGFRAGSPVTYVVSIVNTGATPYTSLTVTDDLGAYDFNGTTLYPLDYNGTVNYYVNGALQPTPAVTAGPPLAISGINVPANGNALIVYQATPNSFAPLSDGSTVTNTATVDGAGLSSPITASASLAAAEGPVLSITKTLSPASVAENGTLTYTFLIENLGSTPATAGDNLSVTDTFEPILSNIAVTLNGVTLTSPESYSYSEATGLFTTVPGVITVPAATYVQDAQTGVWTTVPGTATLTISGTV